MRGTVDCCARTVTGHAAAALPSRPRNSRRLILDPRGQDGIVSRQTRLLEEWRKASDVSFGSAADICAAQAHVRCTPNSDRESRHRKRPCLLYPPKADVCGALAHVCFGPIADMASGHSITSSARPMSVLGTVMPSALAVLRFMIS